MSFETVMPLPLRSMLKAVMMCALVPKPMVAAIGWPASMWAPSSSPEITRSSRIFQFACASSVTSSPSSSKKPFSLAMTRGAQSVSLMKPNFSSVFSGLSAAAVRDGSASVAAMRPRPRAAVRRNARRAISERNELGFIFRYVMYVLVGVFGDVGNGFGGKLEQVVTKHASAQDKIQAGRIGAKTAGAHELQRPRRLVAGRFIGVVVMKHEKVADLTRDAVAAVEIAGESAQENCRRHTHVFRPRQRGGDLWE